jgi:hypothetical protein
MTLNRSRSLPFRFELRHDAEWPVVTKSEPRPREAQLNFAKCGVVFHIISVEAC